MSEKTSQTWMTMSTPYLKAQIVILDHLGFSHDAAYEVLDFNRKRLSSKTARIPIDSVLPLYKAAEKALDDPLIGLRVGFNFRIGNYERTGSIYSYCENLLQVIEMNRRYQRLAIDVAEVKSEASKNPDGSDRHCMHFMPYYDDQLHYQHITDLVMGSYGTAYRWLSWSSGEDIQAVYLPYPEPDDTTLYKRVFQCKAIFNSPIGALQYSPTMMDKPLTTHDPEKLALAIEQLEKMLGDANAQDSLKSAIEEAMRAAMQKGVINAAIVAERLARPERKLRAEMKAAGLTYRALLDSVRQDIFLEQYEEGQSFAAIAQNLAYNDQAAFTRAFRRWYGMPPGKWTPGKQASEQQQNETRT